MIVTLKLDDELYEKYAKRNPGDPRKALAEQLKATQDLEPGIPRLVVENPELREISRLSNGEVQDVPSLVKFIKRSILVSLGGLEIELSLGQRQRLEAQAEFMKQPFDAFAKQQIQAALAKVIGV